MRMTEEQFAELERRRAGFGHGAKVVAAKPAVKAKPKYGNRRVELDGHKFDSAKEARRYMVLREDQLEGRIRRLTLHPVFVLAPACILQGKKKPALRYFADFAYEARNGNEWVLVVEDVKSAATRVNARYRMKLHLMKTVHDIDVEEA